MVYTVDLPDARDRLKAIVETWASECDGFYAASNVTDHKIGAIDLPHEGPEEYGNMWQKIKTMWTYAYDHYLNEYDFFHICGDDVYLVVENLRSFLDGPDVLRLEDGYVDEITRRSSKDCGDDKIAAAGGNNDTYYYYNDQRPLYFGLPMDIQKFPFPFGGPGYTFNQAALALFGDRIESFQWKDTVSPKEDLLMGRFFASHGVYLSHVLDRDGGWRYGEGANFMGMWNWNKPTPFSVKRLRQRYHLKPKEGLDGVSDELSSFHLKIEKERLLSDDAASTTTKDRSNNTVVADLIYRYHAILNDLCPRPPTDRR